jgi:hypothetical protein
MKTKLLFLLIFPITLFAQKSSLQINGRGIGTETNIYKNFHLNVQTSFGFGGGGSSFKLYNSLNIAPSYKLFVAEKAHFDFGVGYRLNSVFAWEGDIYQNQFNTNVFSFVDFSFRPFENSPNLYLTTGVQYVITPNSPNQKGYFMPNFGVKINFDKTAQKRRKVERRKAKTRNL